MWNPFRRKQFKRKSFYQPRDIACNRKPVYDKGGSLMYYRVKDGFYFETVEDIANHPMNAQFSNGIKIVDNTVYAVYESNIGINNYNGFAIGYVKYYWEKD